MGQKETIRRTVARERRRRHPCDAALCDDLLAHVVDLSCMASALVVAAYIALPGEPDLGPLLRSRCASGQAVWLPRYRAETDSYCMALVSCLEHDLIPGHYGIPEPAPSCPTLSATECAASSVTWLIPGVAFDINGARLGRGGGYYDRLLNGTAGVRVGVAWDWQLLAEVPMTDTDEPMNWVVTDHRIIDCAGHGPPHNAAT